MVSSHVAWTYRIVPIAVEDGLMKCIAATDEMTSARKAELEFILGRSINVEERDEADLVSHLHSYYRRSEASGPEQVAVDMSKAESFIDDLIKECKDTGSSDIHFEPLEKESRIRIRIDGRLVERYKVPKHEYPSLVNKIKIRANLDIAEKRLPQDGRIAFKEHGDTFDLRVSVLPGLNGEKVVLRILSQDASRLDLKKVGMGEVHLKQYSEAIRKPHGIILISGPTGSGKTTTLYATLKHLNRTDVNICTVEDPVEYTLSGINQVQVKSDIGLTFASSLRSFLRQDPDIIMLGEIRDAETANMAVRASLTGHLVLSTIHTNSAWDTISRLTDMGVPPFLIATTLSLSVAQRLVRKLCVHCKREEPWEEDLLPQTFKKKHKHPSHHYTAQGCSRCHFTGYSGREAIYEMVSINEEVADLIRSGKLDQSALGFSYERLSDQAFALVTGGITSIEETYSLLIDN